MEIFDVLIRSLTTLRPEAWAVVIVAMGPLMLWLLSSVLKDVQYRQSERQNLVHLRTQLKKQDGDSLLERDELEPELAKMPQMSMVRRIGEALLNSRQLANPDLEALMNLVVARDATKLGTVRNVPNLLMLAGLFGTVLGLSASIGSLGPQIAQAATALNPGELSKSLGNTLSLMQGAFGCSLWGILLSLIASGLLGSMSTDRSRLSSEVQDFALVELVPATFPRATEEQFERQMRMVKQNANLFKQFDTTMNETLTKFDSLVRDSGQSLEQTLGQLTGMTREVNGALEQVTEQVGTLGTQLKDGAMSLSEAQDRATRTFSEAKGGLETQLLGQAKQFGQLQDSFSTSGLRIVEQIGDVSGRLDRTTAAFQESSSTANHENKLLRDKLEQGFGDLGTVLGKQTDAGKTALEGVLTQTKQSMLELNQTQSDVVRMLERHSSQSQAPLETASQSFLGWTETLERLIKRVDKFMGQLEASNKSEGHKVHALGATVSPLEVIETETLEPAELEALLRPSPIPDVLHGDEHRDKTEDTWLIGEEDILEQRLTSQG